MKKSAKFPPPPYAMVAGLYFQPTGCHPEFHTMTARMERVELFTGGRGWVNIQGLWTEVTAGALLWHIQGDQTTARSDLEFPYRCLSVHFQTSQASRIRRVPQLTWWHDSNEINRFIQEVLCAHVDDDFDQDSLLAYAYGRLLFQARRWASEQNRQDVPTKVRQAMEILETQDVTLPEVARKVGWSVAHLHEAFKKTLGTTPHEVALRKRMQKARELLASTDLPIKSIAADCGFSGPAAFCQSFKTRIGLTPLTYRRQQSQGRNRALL